VVVITFFLFTVEDGKPFECKVPDCGKKFTSDATLKSHAARVHVTEDKSFECEACGKTFNKKSYLLLHVRRQHLHTDSPISFP